jgi:hypothetical protein
LKSGRPETIFFPARHKVTDFFTELAPSLKDAIDVFLLSSVVYSIRGHDKKHRSMLINISRFNETQAEIAHIVGDYVAQLKSVIQAYSFLPLKEFLQKPELKHLYDVWMDDKYLGKATPMAFLRTKIMTSIQYVRNCIQRFVYSRWSLSTGPSKRKIVLNMN